MGRPDLLVTVADLDSLWKRPRSLVLKEQEIQL